MLKMVQHVISKPLEMIFNASLSTVHVQSCLKIDNKEHGR